MKFLLRSSILILSIFIITFTSKALAATTIANATAEVIDPVSSVSENTEFDFGTLSNINIDISKELLSSNTAIIHVTGEANTSYTTIVDSNTQLSNANSEFMTVNLSADNINQLLDKNGNGDFDVKAQINTAETQNSGLYVGTYDVTIIY